MYRDIQLNGSKIMLILSNLIYVASVRPIILYGVKKTMFGYVVSYQINLASEEG